MAGNERRVMVVGRPSSTRSAALAAMAALITQQGLAITRKPIEAPGVPLKLLATRSHETIKTVERDELLTERRRVRKAQRRAWASWRRRRVMLDDRLTLLSMGFRGTVSTARLRRFLHHPERGRDARCLIYAMLLHRRHHDGRSFRA